MILPYRCAIPGLDNDTYNIQNDYHRTLVNHYIPDPTEEKKKYDECHLYSFDPNTSIFNNKSHPINATTFKCDKWVYDDSIFKSTFSSKVNFYKFYLFIYLYLVNILSDFE